MKYYENSEKLPPLKPCARKCELTYINKRFEFYSVCRSVFFFYYSTQPSSIVLIDNATLPFPLIHRLIFSIFNFLSVWRGDSKIISKYININHKTHYQWQHQRSKLGIIEDGFEKNYEFSIVLLLLFRVKLYNS